MCAAFNCFGKSVQRIPQSESFVHLQVEQAAKGWSIKRHACRGDRTSPLPVCLRVLAKLVLRHGYWPSGLCTYSVCGEPVAHCRGQQSGQERGDAVPNRAGPDAATEFTSRAFDPNGLQARGVP